MAEPAQQPEPTLDEPEEDQLARIAEHLQAEEVHADDARLTSIESLELWVYQHPALQQPGIYEMINQYGPVILQMIRRMLGF